MNPFSNHHRDTVTVATVAVDDELAETTSNKREVPCHYEQDSSRIVGDNGEVVDVADQFTTHEPVEKGEYVWPPGANTANLDEAVEVSAVKNAPSLDGTTELYEVTL